MKQKKLFESKTLTNLCHGMEFVEITAANSDNFSHSYEVFLDNWRSLCSLCMKGCLSYKTPVKMLLLGSGSVKKIR